MLRGRAEAGAVLKGPPPPPLSARHNWNVVCALPPTVWWMAMPD